MGFSKPKHVLSICFYNLGYDMNVLALQYSRDLLVYIFRMLKTIPLTGKKSPQSSWTKIKSLSESELGVREGGGGCSGSKNAWLFWNLKKKPCEVL